MPTLILLFGACVIGAAPILVRLGDAGSAAIGFWRLAFALPVLALVAGRTAGGVGRPGRWALLAGVAFALDLGFWHYGVANTAVGFPSGGVARRSSTPEILPPRALPAGRRGIVTELRVRDTKFRSASERVAGGPRHYSAGAGAGCYDAYFDVGTREQLEEPCSIE